VRTRIGLLSTVVAAAVLSVVAIPVGAAIFDNKPGITWGNVGAVAAAVGALSAFTTAVLAWRSTRESEAAASEASAEVQLLGELSRVERQARILLGEDHPISVIQIRERLRDLGIWSDSDVYDFDLALRTRNEVAHGGRDLNKTSVAEAVQIMQNLRQPLDQKAAELRPSRSVSPELSAASYFNLLAIAELEHWNVAEILTLIEEYLKAIPAPDIAHDSREVTGTDWRILYRQLNSINSVE